MIDPAALRVGDRIRIAQLGTRHRAAVEDVTENYVALCWGLKPFNQRRDVLMKNSAVEDVTENYVTCFLVGLLIGLAVQLLVFDAPLFQTLSRACP